MQSNFQLCILDFCPQALPRSFAKRQSRTTTFCTVQGWWSCRFPFASPWMILFYLAHFTASVA